MNPRPHKLYKPKAPPNFLLREMCSKISEEKCLTKNAWTLSTKKFLKMHLSQAILEDRFSTKNVEENPSSKQFRKKPLPKRFCLVEIFCLVLFGREFSFDNFGGNLSCQMLCGRGFYLNFIW